MKIRWEKQLWTSHSLHKSKTVKNVHTFVCTKHCSLIACIDKNVRMKSVARMSIFVFPHNYKRESLNFRTSFLRDCWTNLQSWHMLRVNQAYFFAGFPANWANGFAGILSYFNFCWVILAKTLSYCSKTHEVWSILYIFR